MMESEEFDLTAEDTGWKSLADKEGGCPGGVCVCRRDAACLRVDLKAFLKIISCHGDSELYSAIWCRFNSWLDCSSFTSSNAENSGFNRANPSGILLDPHC